MQNVINSVKGTALGVAEYLIPVLKVTSYLSFSEDFITQTTNWLTGL